MALQDYDPVLIYDEYLSCIRCGSEEIRRNGYSKQGKQIYKCKTCNRAHVIK